MTGTSAIRVGLVGAGRIAPVHLEAVCASPWAELVGVADAVPARAEALAARYPGTRVLPSLDALLDAGATLIHVLTPPASHVAVALAALEGGADVLVEKPLATDVDGCARLREAAAARGRLVIPCHSLLADPAVRRVLDAAAGGALGAVVQADVLVTAELPDPGEGATPYPNGGDPFRDLGVHGLYLLRACLGDIDDVHVERSGAATVPGVSFAEWVAVVRCARGTGTIRLSYAARPLQTAFAVQGTTGTLRADVGCGFAAGRRLRPVPSAVGRGLEVLDEALPALASLPRAGWRLLRGRLRSYAGLRAFVEAAHAAAATRRPPPATLDDGAAVVRWVEAVAAPADEAWRTVRARHAGRATPAVLVTGAAGRLGRAVVGALVARGVPVRGLVRRLPAGLPSEVDVVLGDLADAHAVEAAVCGATAVVHAGAAMRGGWAEHARATVAGTRHVVDACRRHAVRLVHVSSLGVLDHVGLDGRRDVCEDAALERRPSERGAYTRAKLEAEALVRQAVETQGLDAVIVRPGILVDGAGPGRDAVSGLVVGRTLLLIGAGDTPLPLADVDAVAAALVRAIAADVPAGTVVHLVDGETPTRAEVSRAVAAREGLRVRALPPRLTAVVARLAAALAARAGRAAPLTPHALRAADAAVSYDCVTARTLLGWEPAARAGAAGRPASACAAPGSPPAGDTRAASHAPGAVPAAEAG